MSWSLFMRISGKIIPLLICFFFVSPTMSKSPAMLSLRGSAALSSFRIQKLLNALSQSAPSIKAIHADFWHFIWNDGEPTTVQVETLKKILTYGPKMAEEAPVGELFLVVPRPGTISPWLPNIVAWRTYSVLSAVLLTMWRKKTDLL